jgi:hypothetical protein
VLITYYQGTSLPVIGRNSAGDWLAILLLGQPAQTGWIALITVDIDFDASTLPEVAAPPAPAIGFTPVQTSLPSHPTATRAKATKTRAPTSKPPTATERAYPGPCFFPYGQP